MNEPIPADFDAGAPENIPVKLDALALKKQKKAEELAEAKAFGQFGVKVMKIKAKAKAVLGKYADGLGIKNIAHGRIFLAGEHASEFIEQMDAIIKDLQSKVPSCDPEVIATFIRLKLDANKQLLESGEAHLRADRFAVPVNEAGMTNVSFPAGQSMVIATGSKGSNPVQQIEDMKPSG